MEVLEKVLGKVKMFALPAKIVLAHSERFRELGIMYRERSIRVGLYTPAACLFRAKEGEALSSLVFRVSGIVGQASLASTVLARFGTHNVVYFCGKTGNITIVPSSESVEDKKRVESAPYTLIEPLLVELSGFAGGYDIEFFAEDRHTKKPPLPDRTNLLRIYPWNSPPGGVETEYVSRIFDFLVAKDGTAVLTFEGVPGRGEFVSDGKNNVVQKIGNNWYLLFSVCEFFNDHTTLQILERVLAEILKRIQSIECKTRTVQSATARCKNFGRKQFLDKTTAWAGDVLGFIQEKIAKDWGEIGRIEESLAEQKRALTNLRRMEADLKDGAHAKRVLDSLPVQWKRIRKDKRIESVSTIGEGIHVVTHPITILEAGCRFPLGTFTLRFNKSGALHIWCNDRLHPEGFPHPHINSDGTPCFGNAASAIRDAVAQQRYDDAIDYVLVWLVNGYDGKLALRKISEWPREVATTTVQNEKGVCVCD
ncbi:MAG: hypothetical protein Q7S52_04940 [bacterium]|nr:hypothetical protein [bacterium]